MPGAKTNCSKYGAGILATTAQRTGGVCVPCKNLGGGLEWSRRQLWRQRGADPSAGIPWHRSPWRDEILMICQKLAAGEIGSAEGSRRLSELAQIVLDGYHGDKWLHKDWEIFETVRGATDHLPFGQSRKLWSAEALRQKDGELHAVEEIYSDSVRKSALKLVQDSKEADCETDLG